MAITVYVTSESILQPQVDFQLVLHSDTFCGISTLVMLCWMLAAMSYMS